MNVKRTFPAVPSDIRDWTRFLQGLLFTREFTATLQGCATSPTGTVRYSVSAGIVCMNVPELIAVSNSAACSLSGLPDEITPDRDQYCLARIVDNGTTAMGVVKIGSDGTVTLYQDLDEGAFTGSGNKGVKALTFSYELD